MSTEIAIFSAARQSLPAAAAMGREPVGVETGA
jgi:hypothetical protein